MTQQEQFFYDNAGYSVAPDETDEQGKARSAKRLADAETWLGQTTHWFETHHDSDADGSFIEDKAERQEWLENAWYAVILDGDTEEVLASLGSCDGENDYKRVVRAELALEIMPEVSE